MYNLSWFHLAEMPDYSLLLSAQCLRCRAKLMLEPKIEPDSYESWQLSRLIMFLLCRCTSCCFLSFVCLKWTLIKTNTGSDIDLSCFFIHSELVSLVKRALSVVNDSLLCAIKCAELGLIPAFNQTRSHYSVMPSSAGFYPLIS